MEGGIKKTSNIERPISNIQWVSQPATANWMFDVGCWMLSALARYWLRYPQISKEVPKLLLA
jgi:hypothetical protein